MKRKLFAILLMLVLTLGLGSGTAFATGEVLGEGEIVPGILEEGDIIPGIIEDGTLTENPEVTEPPVVEDPVPEEEEPPVEEEEPPVYRVNITEDDGGLVTIEEEPVPLANVPQTGDNSVLWFAMIMLSGCCLCILNLSDKKCKA